MANFDETSGAVRCPTQWGSWYQTMEEVFVEVNLPQGTSRKQVKCDIKSKKLNVIINDTTIISGEFPAAIKTDESTWTIEDKKLLQIYILKAHSTADQCWRSLLKGQYAPDDHVFDEMEKKQTLQRYQFENPGMDFSNADITGNYHGGGPQLPSVGPQMAEVPDTSSPLQDPETHNGNQEPTPGAIGGSGGIPDTSKLLKDPEIIEAFKDPEISRAFMDISQTPTNIPEYQNNPKIQGIIQKVSEKLINLGGAKDDMPPGDTSRCDTCSADESEVP
ncbi:NudC domain-containing protein 2 [Mactra antiquata]